MLLGLAVLSGVVYAVTVIQGSMVYEQHGVTDTAYWTPLEQGAFYLTGILGALGLIVVVLGALTSKHRRA